MIRYQLLLEYEIKYFFLGQLQVRPLQPNNVKFYVTKKMILF